MASNRSLRSLSSQLQTHAFNSIEIDYSIIDEDKERDSVSIMYIVLHLGFTCVPLYYYFLKELNIIPNFTVDFKFFTSKLQLNISTAKYRSSLISVFNFQLVYLR